VDVQTAADLVGLAGGHHDYRAGEGAVRRQPTTGRVGCRQLVASLFGVGWSVGVVDPGCSLLVPGCDARWLSASVCRAALQPGQVQPPSRISMPVRGGPV